MFNFFSRTKVKDWEKELLMKIFDLLPFSFRVYKQQIELGLLVRVRVYNDSVNYIGFSYDPNVSKQFENIKKPHICISGIKVFDKGIEQYTEIEVYIMHDLIAGYSTPKVKDFNPDFNRILAKDFQQSYDHNEDFEKIKWLFDEDELKLINSSDIYEVELSGTIYYHLQDLEDGDFIGIDLTGKVYKIKHDPFEIIEQDLSLSEVLKAK